MQETTKNRIILIVFLVGTVSSLFYIFYWLDFFKPVFEIATSPIIIPKGIGEGNVPLCQQRECGPTACDGPYIQSSGSYQCDTHTYVGWKPAITTTFPVSYKPENADQNPLLILGQPYTKSAWNVEIIDQGTGIAQVKLHFADNNVFPVDVNNNLFFQGTPDDKVLTVNFSNTQSYSFNADIYAWIQRRGTTFSNSDVIDLSKNDFTFVPGNNIIQFIMPRNIDYGVYDFHMVVAEYKEVGLPGYYNVQAYQLQITNYISSSFQVIPKDLWLVIKRGQSPPDGYELQKPYQTSSGLCEQDECVVQNADLFSISCLQSQSLKCPVTERYSYACTPLGCTPIISQNVNCNSDSQCSPSQVCETSSGTCIDKGIIGSLLDCKQSAYIPCAGVTAQCVNNKWTYSGKCSLPDIIPTIPKQDKLTSYLLDALIAIFLVSGIILTYKIFKRR